MSGTSRHIAAWTLLELCFVMLLTSIMVTMAIPAWQRHMQYVELNNAQQSLYNAINYVKLLSISNQQTLSLCSFNVNWAKGFKVVVSSPHQSCQQSPPLRQWDFKHADKLSIKWRGFDKKQQLVFFPHPHHWAVNGRFTLTLANQKPINLIINRLGHVSKD